MSEFEDKKICFVSFVSRDDKPLYIQSFEPEKETAETENVNRFLKYNFLSHMALDIIASPSSISIREQQQDADIKSGAVLLVIQDDVSVYGYESNTGLKILIGFDNHSESSPGAMNLKKLFGDVHKVYIKTICNPFLDISDKSDDNESILQTPTFDKNIKTLVGQWNGS